MSKKLIHHKNLPRKLPLSSVVLSFFLMHYIDAPVWLYILIGLYWLLFVIKVFGSWKNDKHVNIFNTFTQKEKPKKEKFSERISRKYKKQKS